jgi:predicted sulfurtransferase
MQSDTVIIDVRNHYEAHIGRFIGIPTPQYNIVNKIFSIWSERKRGREGGKDGGMEPESEYASEQA